MIPVEYVDDEPGFLEITKSIFERSGQITVDCAESGLESLEKIEKNHHNVVVSDYQVPGRDGIQILRILRKSGKDVPFIGFTGKGREKYAVSAFENGAGFHVQKGGDLRAQFTELGKKIVQAFELSRAQQYRKENEARLRQIINFLPDAMFAVDRDGRVITWNRAIEKMTGVPAGEILGKGNYEYAIPFYHERRPILIDLALRKDQDIIRKYKYVRPDGDSLVAETFIPHFNGGRGVHLWGVAIPLHDAEGKVIGAIEFIRDITAWKVAESELTKKNEELHAAYEQIAASEEELKQNLQELEKNHRVLERNERRFRQLFETMHEGLALHKILRDDGGRAVDYRILAVNRAYEEIFGLKRDFVVGKKAREAYQTNDAPFIEIYAGVAESGEPASFQTFFAPLGRYFRISVYSPGKDHFVTVFEDVTDRVILEQEQKKAEEKLREAIRLARLGFWEWDIAEDRVWWSHELYDMMKWDPQVPPPPYKALSRFYTPQSWEILSQAAGRAVSQGEPYDLELEVIRPDGGKRWRRETGRPLRDANGVIIGLHGTVQDITGLKSVGETLKRVNRKMALLTGITRHDIQNSITAALGVLDLMDNEDPKTQDAYRERLGSILRKISRQIQFTREYENLGQQEPAWQSLDRGLSNLEVPMEVSLSRDTCNTEVLADPVFRKVFENLLDNSVRHGGPSLKRVHVFCQREGEDLVIVWEDDGVGIPAHEKENVFELHYGKNTGLGLFLVREILGITGMSIRETGSEGKGARFEIRVPAGMWRHETGSP